MPRVEIIPQDWEGSKEQQNGDGSPTVDVCKSCHNDFTEGEELSDTSISELKQFRQGDMVGSTEVEHPPYDDDDYRCACCGRRLKEKDE